MRIYFKTVFYEFECAGLFHYLPLVYMYLAHIALTFPFHFLFSISLSHPFFFRNFYQFPSSQYCTVPNHTTLTRLQFLPVTGVPLDRTSIFF